MDTTMRPMMPRLRFLLAGAVAALIFGAPGVMAADAPEGTFPDPARQPVFHRSQSSGADVGRLRIPAIGVDEVVRSGVSMSVIDRGVAQWAGTSPAGGPGNVVLAGHRTTHTRPFHDLDRLDAGDLVYLEDGSGFWVMYEVTESFVVDPSAMWITHDRPVPTVTLFACHPKGSDRYRLVVTAELVAGRRIA